MRLRTVLRPKICVWTATLVIALLMPLVTSEFIVRLLISIFIFTIYSSAWNLLAYSGQGSIGHAAFFGVGAYASALLAGNFGLTPFITLFLGGGFAAILGFFIGLLCVRLKEWFFGMATFAFAIIFQMLTVDQFAWMTGGWDGVFPLPLVSSTVPNYVIYRYYIVLILAATIILIIHTLTKSRIGLALTAIRENELEARVLGIPVMGYKLLAFVLSTFFTGIAGGLQAHHYGHLCPEVYSINNSFWPIMYSIAGGLFTVEGPMIGTSVIIFLLEGLRGLGTFERFILVGLALILILIFMPKGAVSLIKKAIAFVHYRF